MGVWGNKLYQNDIALDVKDSYKELLQDGKTNEEAYNEMISSNIDLLKSERDGDIVMFILPFADTLWNYGRLTKQYKETCLNLITECKEDKLKNKENSYCIYSINELEKLETKLKSQQPEEKKVKKIIPYICDWEDYDTFAYKLESNYAKEKGLYGRYLIIIKIDVTKTYPKNISPIVWIKITNDEKIPKTLEEINKLKFVQTRSDVYEKRLILCGFANYNEISKIKFKTDEYGYLVTYRLILDTTSRNSIPKKMKHIGNFKGILPPENEFAKINKCNIILTFWKKLEEDCLRYYFSYNERNSDIYNDEYRKNILPEIKKTEQNVEKIFVEFVKNTKNEE